MKKGMLFKLSHREKRVKKMNLLHFPASTLKNFLILELPKPFTDCWNRSLIAGTVHMLLLQIPTTQF